MGETEARRAKSREREAEVAEGESRGREQRAATQGGRGWRAGAAVERQREESKRDFFPKELFFFQD